MFPQSGCNPLAVTSVHEVDAAAECVLQIWGPVAFPNSDWRAHPHSYQLLEQALRALALAHLTKTNSRPTLSDLPLFWACAERREEIIGELTEAQLSRPNVLAMYGPQGMFEFLGPHQQADHTRPVLRVWPQVIAFFLKRPVLTLTPEQLTPVRVSNRNRLVVRGQQ